MACHAGDTFVELGSANSDKTLAASALADVSVGPAGVDGPLLDRLTEMIAGDGRPAAIEFELGDVKPAQAAQVVAGFYYDGRVFLVVDAGAARPLVIGLTPHQAEALGRDLVDGVTAGAIYHRHRRCEPVVTALPVQSKPSSSTASRAIVGPAMRIVREDEPPATT